MSFDKFLLAIESRDLSQADKSIIRVYFFPKLFLNNKVYGYTKNNYVFGNFVVCFGQFFQSKFARWKSKHYAESSDLSC